MAEQGERGGEAALELALASGEWAQASRGSALGGGDFRSGFQPSLQLPARATANARRASAQPKSNDAATTETLGHPSAPSANKPRRRRRPVVGSPAQSAAARRELAEVVPKQVTVQEEAVSPEELLHFAHAFAATASERRALHSGSILQPKANIMKAVGVALRGVLFLEEHRSVIAQTGVKMTLVRRIGTFARALAHAHSLVTSATDVWAPSPYEDASVLPMAPDASHGVITRAQRLKELSKGALRARLRLRADVTNLIVQGSLPPTALECLSHKVGYFNTAKDVLALVHLIRQVGTDAPCQSTFDDATLEEFSALAQELFAYAARRPRPGAPSEQRAKALDEQARAFTLLWHAYSEAQRAVAMLLWGKGDYRAVLPSLMVGVGRKRRR